MKIRLLAFLFWMFFPWAGFAGSLLDLEAMAQDFVLETKQIDIPGYPDAFNPSIVRWRGSLLMSFRHIPGSKKTFDSFIGLIQLDSDFKPIGSPRY